MPNKNAWLYFLQEFRKKNPSLKGKAVMREAAKKYKKKAAAPAKKKGRRKA